MGARRVDFGSQKWVEKKEGQKVEEKWRKMVEGVKKVARGRSGRARGEDGCRSLAGPGLLALKNID